MRGRRRARYRDERARGGGLHARAARADPEAGLVGVRRAASVRNGSNIPWIMAPIPRAQVQGRVEEVLAELIAHVHPRPPGLGGIFWHGGPVTVSGEPQPFVSGLSCRVPRLP